MNQVKQQVHYWCEDTRKGLAAGENVTVAILDTGMAPHPDFKGRIKAFADCVNGRKLLYDDSGHGTHVAGILAGDGRMSKGVLAGMAPKAAICAVKVLDGKGEGNVEHILKGLKWTKENAEKLGIRVVNISAGAKRGLEEEKELRLLEAVDGLWDMGLLVTVSAGNYGPKEGTIAVPGTSRKVITVGALKEGKETGCSGAGPTGECVVKPDLSAPGYQIISCNNVSLKARKPYTVKSGSSMATPVVSGAIAALLSKYPDMTNVEIKLKLWETCERIAGNLSGTGWGMLRVDRLLNVK